MDPKFQPAIVAITSGNIDGLRSLLSEDPSLATARSSRDHPTLLQCLVLDAKDVPNMVEMARVLIDAGAEINGPLVAAASINNVDAAAALLDSGALINGTGGWSPLEEALYWGNDATVDLLLERGASVHNLRIASGLGRVDLIAGFFSSEGSLKPEAGKIDWPFGNPQSSNLPSKIKEELQAKIAGWSNDSQNIINNAFIYACMRNRLEAAKLLLQKGVEIDAIPPGFDYAGTGLHYAALRGRREMVEFLIAQGANPNVRDEKVNQSPAGWADYGGHQSLRDYLEQTAKIRAQNE
jgi:ankyrin repeat protein